MIAQYADDFVIYASGTNLADSVLNIQNALDTMVLILNNLGLELSCTKTKVCNFTRGRKKHLININVNGRVLEQIDNIKYLGIWLDKGLRWGKHINEIWDKVQRFLSLLKVLAGSNWGVHPKHIRRLYVALLRSRMEYACFLYDSSTKTHLSKLDKVQNQALRIIGGFIRSTPIHVMESELCLPPLFVRRKYLAYKFYLKSKSWDNNLTITLLQELNALCSNAYWRDKKLPLLVTIFSDEEPLVVASSDPLEMFALNIWLSAIPVENIIRTSLDCVTNSKDQYNAILLKYEVLREIDLIYTNWHKIYTDGSKNSNGIGAAFYDPLNTGNSMCFRIATPICIMTAELTAIYEALR